MTPGFNEEDSAYFRPEDRETEVYFKQHRGIVFPAWLRGLGFDDESYSNDMCAKATRYIGEHECLAVWVDCANPADREHPDCAEFIVEHVRNEDEHLNGEAPELYRGNDAAAAEAVVREFFKERK